MKYKVTASNRFNKDLKRCQKRGLNMRLIYEVIHLLEESGTLPSHYHPHKLSGDKDGIMECHIQPNWLMTWEQDNDKLILLLLQTGTHADLF